MVLTRTEHDTYTWLRSNGPAHCDDVGRALRCSGDAAYFRLRNLKKKGLVVRHNRLKWRAVDPT